MPATTVSSAKWNRMCVWHMWTLHPQHPPVTVMEATFFFLTLTWTHKYSTDLYGLEVILHGCVNTLLTLTEIPLALVGEWNKVWNTDLGWLFNGYVVVGKCWRKWEVKVGATGRKQGKGRRRHRWALCLLSQGSACCVAGLTSAQSIEFPCVSDWLSNSNHLNSNVKSIFF